jgi:hypothetical protein
MKTINRRDSFVNDKIRASETKTKLTIFATGYRATIME